MALDLTALTEYVDQNRDKLVGGLIAKAKTVQVLEVQTGYKHKGTINILDTDVVLQADACGRTPDGTTTVTQRELAVGAIKVEENLCPKDLNKYFLQHDLQAGSKDESIPFEEMYADRKVMKIAAANEVLIWQGDTTSGTNNLSYTDGLLKIIDAEATVIDGNPDDIASITVSNIEAIIDAMYALMPAEVVGSGEGAFFLGQDLFRTYTQALKNANLYHYSADNSEFEITVPATNIKMYGVAGLNGTDRIIAARTTNLVVGVDLENEEETFEMWYSKDDKVVKFDAAYKLGTQVKFPEEIVEFTVVTP